MGKTTLKKTSFREIKEHFYREGEKRVGINVNIVNGTMTGTDHGRMADNLKQY
ncbi:MAG: hypothetical protein ACLUDU_05775 [Butyricimonas faecihominis]